MYEEHSELHLPPDDSMLWRYLSFTKFVSLLDQQALFFARADKLGDPFEGSVSKTTVDLRPHVHKGLSESGISALTRAQRNMPRFTLINCWHSSEYESDAMWRLYSGEYDGIAIRTTIESLKQSFTGDQRIFLGRVAYVDYETALIPEGNVLLPYLTKRKSFEHENEVRAIYMEALRDGPVDLSQDICEIGLFFDVDISRIVSEIVVAPFAQEWFLALVRSVASRYGLNAPARRSSLAKSPVWD